MNCIRRIDPFQLHVSRSIFCQPLGNFHIERRIVDQVANRLREIVDADIRLNGNRFDGRSHSNLSKFNLHDKIDILKYRPEKDVHLYRCGNYFNYLHSYMVPSTGYLQTLFCALTARESSSSIQRIKRQILPFEEAPTYGRTLKRAYEWAKLMIRKPSTASTKTDSGKHRRFYPNRETKHNNMLSEIGNLIKADIDNIRLIAIADRPVRVKQPFPTAFVCN